MCRSRAPYRLCVRDTLKTKGARLRNSVMFPRLRKLDFVVSAVAGFKVMTWRWLYGDTIPLREYFYPDARPAR
jgi:hypothetical protein